MRPASARSCAEYCSSGVAQVACGFELRAARMKWGPLCSAIPQLKLKWRLSRSCATGQRKHQTLSTTAGDQMQRHSSPMAVYSCWYWIKPSVRLNATELAWQSIHTTRKTSARSQLLRSNTRFWTLSSLTWWTSGETPAPGAFKKAAEVAGLGVRSRQETATAGSNGNGTTTTRREHRYRCRV